MWNSEQPSSRLNPSFHKEYSNKDYLEYYLKKKRLRLSESTFTTIYHYFVKCNHSERSPHRQPTSDRYMSDDTCTPFSFQRTAAWLPITTHTPTPPRIRHHKPIHKLDFIPTEHCVTSNPQITYTTVTSGRSAFCRQSPLISYSFYILSAECRARSYDVLRRIFSGIWN
jgi:hypothetical protein